MYVIRPENKVVRGSENHQLYFFVLSKRGPLTLVQGGHSSVFLVYGMFFLLAQHSWNRYPGQILAIMR